MVQFVFGTSEQNHKLCLLWDTSLGLTQWVFRYHLLLIFLFGGISDSFFYLVAQSTDPQVISGSADSTIRCWDMRNGKAMVVLTNHKKSVRSLVLHPTDYSFASAAAGFNLPFSLPQQFTVLIFKKIDSN